MNIIDATPPKDFPQQVIVMDREFAKRHPSKAFYLRVGQADSPDVDIVHLDDAVTPVQARNMAVEKGYEPTHWMEVANGILWRFNTV
jgi:hypothetical protein